MVFRLPTPFDTIVPHAPLSNGRRARARPWRGTFILHGISLFQSADGQQRLFVASAETEGENSRTDLWPKQFNMQVVQPVCPLADVQAWVTRNDVPLCMFMPDRHAVGGIGSTDSVANEANFRTLSTVLNENQLLCMAPWPTPGFSETRAGAGILIYPNTASTGLLTGAIFIDTPFPDIISILPGNDESSGTSAIPSGLPATATTGGGIPEYSRNTDLSGFAPLDDPGSGSYGAGSAVEQRQYTLRQTGHVQVQVELRPDDSPVPASVTMRSIQRPQIFPMTSSASSSLSINQVHYQPQAYSHSYNTSVDNSTNTKPPMDSFSGNCEGIAIAASGLEAATPATLRAALAAAPFDWSVFDDTTDGSGSTSPGSTRTW